jgi:hypothetical protein
MRWAISYEHWGSRVRLYDARSLASIRRQRRVPALILTHLPCLPILVPVSYTTSHERKLLRGSFKRQEKHLVVDAVRLTSSGIPSNTVMKSLGGWIGHARRRSTLNILIPLFYSKHCGAHRAAAIPYLIHPEPWRSLFITLVP